MTKQKIYIAGPMRGIKEFNFPAFFDAEKILILRNFEVFNPARRDVEYFGIDVSDCLGLLDEIPSFPFKEAFRYDCMRICDADFIYMLSNWESSAGARAEHAIAVALGLNIIYENNEVSEDNYDTGS